MKFVLVIDVADDVAEAYEDFTVDYDFRGTPIEDRTVNESIKYIEDAEPRPLPKKAEMTDDWRVAGLIETESGRMVRCYFKGYNTCLSETTGETE